MIYLLIRSNVIPHLQVIAHMCRASRWSYVFMSYHIGWKPRWRPATGPVTSLFSLSETECTSLERCCTWRRSKGRNWTNWTLNNLNMEPYGTHINRINQLLKLNLGTGWNWMELDETGTKLDETGWNWTKLGCPKEFCHWTWSTYVNLSFQVSSTPQDAVSGLTIEPCTASWEDVPQGDTVMARWSLKCYEVSKCWVKPVQDKNYRKCRIGVKWWANGDSHIEWWL